MFSCASFTRRSEGIAVRSCAQRCSQRCKSCLKTESQAALCGKMNPATRDLYDNMSHIRMCRPASCFRGTSLTLDNVSYRTTNQLVIRVRWRALLHARSHFLRLFRPLHAFFDTLTTSGTTPFAIANEYDIVSRRAAAPQVQRFALTRSPAWSGSHRCRNDAPPHEALPAISREPIVSRVPGIIPPLRQRSHESSTNSLARDHRLQPAARESTAPRVLNEACAHFIPLHSRHDVVRESRCE